jgi:DNA-binding winged helix-turn-helix (wHTH) protein
MHTTTLRHNGLDQAVVVPSADFVVGDWLVEPDLNRVSRNGRLSHVRPQLMDLLVYLARNTGRTVPHDELLSSVWPGQPYTSRTGLPRCIAELRQSLGDRARESTVIQTIPKRGYRLIASVGPAPEVAPVTKSAALSPPQPACAGEPAQASGSTMASVATSDALIRVEAAGAPRSGRQLAWLSRARQHVARVWGLVRSRAS